jgi:hypothetical protein
MTEGRKQTCPHCLITEAKGTYCTKCPRPTEMTWVHPSAKGRRDGRFSPMNRGRRQPDMTKTLDEMGRPGRFTKVDRTGIRGPSTETFGGTEQGTGPFRFRREESAIPRSDPSPATLRSLFAYGQRFVRPSRPCHGDEIDSSPPRAWCDGAPAGSSARTRAPGDLTAAESGWNAKR